MRLLKVMTTVLLLGVEACAATGVPQEQAPQFQQAAGFPYNSFYCP
jgi:hypothetical protein